MSAAATPRKKVRDADASRARVFAAAGEEFALRGFDGAKVDRIAERAGVNKAMLYYHFTDKAALYSAVLGDMFASVAASLRTMREAGGSPEAQVAAFIDVIAREGRSRPHFPGMWLRELADGGANLAAKNFGDMSMIIGTIGEILTEGEAAGTLRAMPPFLVQMGIVGPLFLFLATAPMRARLKAKMPVRVPEVETEVFVDYVKRMTIGALKTGIGDRRNVGTRAAKAVRAPRRRSRRTVAGRTRKRSAGKL